MLCTEVLFEMGRLSSTKFLSNPGEPSRTQSLFRMHIRVAVATAIATLAALGAALDYHSRDGYGSGKAISITKNFSLVNADTSVDFNALKLHVASVRAYVICAPITLRLLSTCFFL
jgi:hypothetical protein